MPNRRDFIKGVAGAAGGRLWAARRAFTRDALAQNQGQGQGRVGAAVAEEAAAASKRSRLVRWCGVKCASATSASK